MTSRRCASVVLLATVGCLHACSEDSPTTGAGDAQGGAAGAAQGGAAGAAQGGAAGQAGLGGGSSGAGDDASAGGGSAGAGGQAGTSGGSPDAGEVEAGGAAGADSGVVHGALGPSCEGGLICSVNATSCCESNLIPGGTFPMGRGTEDCGDAGCQSGAGNEGCPNNCLCIADEQPEHDATVSDFFLDSFEVTVGRFRRFVAAYTGAPPAPGAGAHPAIPGSGWQSPAWDGALPDKVTLIKNIKCDVTSQTWTDAASDHENYPMNCVTWYEAMAFCLWDGGFLPTEAEWEYAAAGGDANRLYPWGTEDPSIKEIYANDYYSDKSPLINVGTHAAGRSRWGQSDLAGSLWEWTLDWFDASWYGGGGASCNNCVNLAPSVHRSLRGGDYYQFVDGLRSTYRVGRDPAIRMSSIGFRCARAK